MGKIICLMGKSSTGKDTIFKELLKENPFGLKTIVPYTTRPIREGERDGVEYFFVDEDRYLALEAEGKVIEGRSYNTFHGVWRYFTVDDGQINLETDNYILIGTLEAYEGLKNYFGQDKMLPVMIELDDGIRLERALGRERKQAQPKYEEMCRRFLADSEDFSEERVREAGVDRSFRNDELERCLQEIHQYLEQML
ncbi:MAG: guanylate kinase [Lachnospiraceae bacterium]|nr:guanylate kinase [Lachnospiraceae bacterium]